MLTVVQHFLLSAKARTLSLAAITRMTDDGAHARFVAIRFANNGGAPFCPRCGCIAVYAHATRRIWKCKACGHQFSVTSGTIFASASCRSATTSRPSPSTTSRPSPPS